MKKKNRQALIRKIITGFVALSLVGVGVIYPISSNLEKPLAWWVILLFILGLFLLYVVLTILFDYLARKEEK